MITQSRKERRRKVLAKLVRQPIEKVEKDRLIKMLHKLFCSLFFLFRVRWDILTAILEAQKQRVARQGIEIEGLQPNPPMHLSADLQQGIKSLTHAVCERKVEH